MRGSSAPRDTQTPSPCPLPPKAGGEGGEESPIAGGEGEEKLRSSNPDGYSPALFTRERITDFAIGKPSEAFGERYRAFDRERVIARLPGPPFQFIDRIVDIQNCDQWKLAAGGEIVAEYDVPANEWYFASNRQPTMPFAVLLEIALQPCGWLAAYLGSALTSDVDLSFRNLGGSATQFEAVGPDAGTLRTWVKITDRKSTRLNSSHIQKSRMPSSA